MSKKKIDLEKIYFEINDIIKTVLTEIRVKNDRDCFSQTVAAAYADIIQKCKASKIILDNEIEVAAKIILRSATENFIDLINLSKDKEYLALIHYHTAKNEMKQLINLKNIDPSHNIDGKISHAEEVVENYKKQMPDKYQKFIKLLNVFNKFELANMVDWYKTIYASFSASTHGQDIYNRIDYTNMQILLDRSIDKDSVIRYYYTINTILIDSTILYMSISNYSNKEIEDQMKITYESLNQMLKKRGLIYVE